MHPEIKRRGETLELKCVGPRAFGLIKQNRPGKFTIEGKYPLVKFGNFAQVGDDSDSDDLPNPTETETEDIVISTSEHELEENHVPPVAIVAEEHDQMKNVEVRSDYDADDDDEDDFEENLMDNVTVNDDEEADENDEFFDGMDLSGFNNEEIPLNLDLDHDNIGPSSEFLDRFFINVNEVAQTTTETRVVDEVLETMPPTSKPMDDISSQMDATSGIPPLFGVIPTSMPSMCDQILTQTSQPSVKRR
ncbi:histone chaperone RTT106-like [Lactuca sativa]|uniref:histone chaperone RTT106-like n=1 Tax=Lactuca sativa TaxID=4236 RepID=UPI000CD93E5E|nr:histone chaperone RTT106-like [Lactuca sativa]